MPEQGEPGLELDRIDGNEIVTGLCPAVGEIGADGGA